MYPASASYEVSSLIMSFQAALTASKGVSLNERLRLGDGSSSTGTSPRVEVKASREVTVCSYWSLYRHVGVSPAGETALSKASRAALSFCSAWGVVNVVR